MIVSRITDQPRLAKETFLRNASLRGLSSYGLERNCQCHRESFCNQVRHSQLQLWVGSDCGDMGISERGSKMYARCLKTWALLPEKFWSENLKSWPKLHKHWSGSQDELHLFTMHSTGAKDCLTACSCSKGIGWHHWHLLGFHRAVATHGGLQHIRQYEQQMDWTQRSEWNGRGNRVPVDPVDVFSGS